MIYIWLFYVEGTLLILRKVILLKDVCFFLVLFILNK